MALPLSILIKELFVSTNDKDDDKTIIQTSIEGINISKEGDRTETTGTVSATLEDLSESGLSEQSSLVMKEAVGVPTLVIFTFDQKGGQFPLSNGKSFQVGREKVDIVISHRSVSALHCTFSNEDGIIFLMENGSTNGTFLNRERLKPHRRVIVDDGDDIYIGQVKVRILMPESKGTSNEDFSASQVGEQTIVESQPFPSQSPEGLLGQDLPKEDVTLEIRAPVSAQKSSPSRIHQYWGKKNQVSIARHRESLSEDVNLAGPFVRLWAFAGDFIFNHFIVILLFHFQFSLDIIEGLKKNWLPEINTVLGELLGMSDLADILIIPLLIFLVFRLFCILLFGVSLAQAMMGLRGMDGFLWNRLGGVIRVFWEFLLGGFIIFDIPLLWKKRSLKEFFSRTAIVKGPPIVRFVASVTLIPLMMVLPLVSDFILQWDYHKGIVVTPYNLPPLFTKKVQKGSLFDFSSLALQVSSSPVFDKDQFLFLVGYKIVSKNKKTHLYKRVALFDRKLNQSAYLTVLFPNKISKAITQIFSDDLILETQYPGASSLFPGLKMSDVVLTTKSKEMIPNGNKVEELLKMSFALNISSVISNIISGNFSVNKLAQLRQFFVEEFQLAPQSQIEIVKLNQRHFLKINPEPLNMTIGRFVKIYLIPIDTFRGMIYELSYFNRDGGEIVALKLLRHLFTGGHFIFDGPPSIPFKEDLSQVTLGHCMDHLFSFRPEDHSKADIVYKGYLNYVNEVSLAHAGREVSKSEKEAERTFLLEELSSLSEVEGIWSRVKKASVSKGFQYQRDRLKNNEFK